MFETHDTGLFLTFENGWKVSVQWGPGCYTKGRGLNPQYSKQTGNIVVHEAEAAVLNPAGHMIDMEHSGEKVAGWVSADEVARLIETVSNLKDTDKPSPLKFRKSEEK